jgi:hypothetical protein
LVVAPEIELPLKNHLYEVALVALAVRTTLPPEQKVVGPLALIVGVAAEGFTVTEVGVLGGELHPPALVTTRV